MYCRSRASRDDGDLAGNVGYNRRENVVHVDLACRELCVLYSLFGCIGDVGRNAFILQALEAFNACRARCSGEGHASGQMEGVSASFSLFLCTIPDRAGSSGYEYWMRRRK